MAAKSTSDGEESTGLATDRDGAERFATSRGAEPGLTLDVLRRKLDAAIDAEQWPAVAVIRERMREVEHEAAGNVIELRRSRP